MLADQVSVAESRKRDQCVVSAKPAIVTSVGNLQRLRNKLDLANTAAAKLHIESALGLSIRVDHLLRSANTTERALDRDVR